MKLGRKYWISVIWGTAMMAVLLVLLAFGVTSDVVLCAWMAAFVAIPVQFSLANASVTRAYAKAGEPDAALQNDGR